MPFRDVDTADARKKVDPLGVFSPHQLSENMTESFFGRSRKTCGARSPQKLRGETGRLDILCEHGFVRFLGPFVAVVDEVGDGVIGKESFDPFMQDQREL